MFGGIVNCATIASGIVGACKRIELKVPLIVRLEGNIYKVFFSPLLISQQTLLQEPMLMQQSRSLKIQGFPFKVQVTLMMLLKKQ